MGRIWIPGGGGGGGIDPDELTAVAADVLNGKIAGVKDSDEPVSGTMPNRGSPTSSLNAGGSYTIQAGYYSGGKVTANTLASQTSATAAAGDILTGKTAWVNGSKLTGTMATMAGKTITPSSSKQTVSCNGKKMTGNIVINAIPSGVSTSFISAGGKNDASTYSGESTDYDTITPNGDAPPYYLSNASRTKFSAIKACANGLILTGERYCYDFYFSGSSTNRMSKSTANFWARPVLCANIASITAKVHAIWTASRRSDRINIRLGLYLCYFNDGQEGIQALESVGATGFDRDDTQTHTDDFILTCNLNYKGTYKWVASCVRFSCSIDNSTPGIRLTLGKGTGITDILCTTA